MVAQCCRAAARGEPRGPRSAPRYYGGLRPSAPGRGAPSARVWPAEPRQGSVRTTSPRARPRQRSACGTSRRRPPSTWSPAA
eukprot:66062-Alexandrium_andersonii.AAC.1